MNIDKNKKARLLSTLIGVLVFSPALLAEVLYVDQRATGLNTGLAWDQAFADLNQALDMAQAGDEIRVATGRYRPAVPDGDPNATFLLVSGVAVRGGYAGFGADDPDIRDVNEFPTILSGDLNSDDGEDWSFREDNVIHVVTAIGTDANTVLDGLCIADGHAFRIDRAYIPWLDPNSRGYDRRDSSSGGGLLVRTATLDQACAITLQNCVFQNNTSIVGGAAICCVYDSVLTLHQCDFFDNYAEFGAGAIASRHSNSETFLSHCNFIGNGSKTGASVIESGSSRFSAEHCRFLGNLCTSPYPQGSMVDCDNGEVLLDNCLFSGNRHEKIISTSFGTLNLLNTQSSSSSTQDSPMVMCKATIPTKPKSCRWRMCPTAAGPTSRAATILAIPVSFLSPGPENPPWDFSGR